MLQMQFEGMAAKADEASSPQPSSLLQHLPDDPRRHESLH